MTPLDKNDEKYEKMSNEINVLKRRISILEKNDTRISKDVQYLQNKTKNLEKSITSLNNLYKTVKSVVDRISGYIRIK